ncbi:MAG: TonB-dependent receptor, partial [Bacteroidota bacterium]
STNRVRAYLNNIPLSTGEGETTIEDIDLNVIDRIEVLKGPASSIYGAGLAGVINLKTTSSIKSPFVSTDFQVGSYGLVRSVNQLGWGTANSANTITYTNTNSDGYRENNEYDRQSLLVTSNNRISDKSSISFLGQWTDLKSFIPSSINFDTFQESPRSAAPNWLAARGFEDYTTVTLGTTLRSSIRPWIDNSLSIFGSFRNSNEVRPFNTLKESSNTFGFRNLVDLTTRLFNLNPKLTVGIELLRDDYDFSTQAPDSLQTLISLNNELRTNLNVFINSHWPISDRLILIAGINLNSTQYDLEDLILTDGNDQSGSYEFDNVFSPRLAINYLLKPTISIHASISHGFSPPTLQETLLPDGLINNDIQPETGINYELGSRGDLFDRRLSYDISLYSTDIENLLVARRVDQDQFVGINAGESRHQGIEASLSYEILNDPNERNTLVSTLSFSAVNHEFVDFIDGDEDFSGNELPGNPSSVFNGIIDYSNSWGLFGNINIQGVGEQRLRDDNILTEDGYILTNIKVGYNQEVGPLKFTFYTGINNLFDEAYASQILINAGSFGGNAPRYYYPGLPRNYFGGVSVKWSLNKR